jgi:signal transduction histidine kinase/FixJ family two-component response regulator
MAEGILLVDDEPGIRTVLSIALADLGHEVHCAQNVDEALELFDERRPPIVLTDVKMPGRSGLDLLQAVKERDKDAEVIMITGHGDMDLAIKSLQLDACDFVTKPINTDALCIALKRARERIDMRAALREHTENLERLVEEKSELLLATERQLAACQVVEGLTRALSGVAAEVEHGGVFNELPCLVSLHDPYLEIVATNQLYKDRLGDKVGANSWEIYCERKRGDDECPVSKTFRTGQGQRSDEVVRTLDGREIPVTVHTAPIKGEHDVEYVLEISVDQEEAQRLKGELLFSQHRFRQLFDAVPCAISVQDREFRLLETNRRYKADFDVRPGEVATQRRGGRRENCPVAATLADGASHETEEVVRGADGRAHHLLVQTAPIADAAGEVVQVLELSTDITQIRELQDHLTSLGLLLGSVSHSVKGLLTALDGGMYRVESGLKREDPEMVRAGWRVVRGMTARIRSMMLDVLYYAKDRELHLAEVDAARFAEGVAEVAEPRARAAGLEFLAQISPGLGAFEADAGALAPALVNMLENAVEACAADRAKERHAVVFTASASGPDVVFTVEDNGTGMDEPTREKVFTLFFSSKGDRGTGLGLFIAGQVVEKHGGNIRVDSEPGRGTRFTIRMPRKRLETARSAAAAPAQGPASAGKAAKT